VANLPQVSTTPAAKFASGFNNTGGNSATSINDTGSKFFHQFCVNDNRGKFATGVNNADGKLPQESTIAVANNGSNYQTADNLK
jgi:hypothetical protein